MKIERGILGIDSRNELVVYMPSRIYSINTISMLEREFKSKEKLLGVIIDGRYNIIEEFELAEHIKVFGYIVKHDLVKSTITVQTIENFERHTFDPFNAEYELGSEIKMIRDYKRNNVAVLKN